jgi:ADP-heptose:LPS heptosyltransferase
MGIDHFKTQKHIELAGKTNLKELVALIAGAKAVVSNDSGPMHIAAALDKPVVALFGPTDPVKTGPYGWQKNKNLKVLTSGASCSPCFRKKCKKFTCMNMINVETVFNALKEYL